MKTVRRKDRFQLSKFIEHDFESNEGVINPLTGGGTYMSHFFVFLITEQ